MVKVTLSELAVANKVLRDMAQNGDKLPIGAAYKIGRIIRVVAPEVASVEQKHDELVKKYGDPTEEGGAAIKQNSPAWFDFIREYNEMLEIEIELGVDPLRVSELEGISLSVSDMLALYKFVIE